MTRNTTDLRAGMEDSSQIPLQAMDSPVQPATLEPPPIESAVDGAHTATLDWKPAHGTTTTTTTTTTTISTVRLLNGVGDDDRDGGDFDAAFFPRTLTLEEQDLVEAAAVTMTMSSLAASAKLHSASAAPSSSSSYFHRISQPKRSRQTRLTASFAGAGRRSPSHRSVKADGHGDPDNPADDDDDPDNRDNDGHDDDRYAANGRHGWAWSWRWLRLMVCVWLEFLIRLGLLAEFEGPNMRKLRNMRSLRQQYRVRRLVRRMSKRRSLFEWACTGWHWNLFLTQVRSFARQRENMRLLLLLDLLVDMTVCLLYLYEMNDPVTSSLDQWFLLSRSKWLFIVFVVLSFYNLSVSLVNLLLTRHPLQFLFSWNTLVDCLTAVPFVVALCFPNGQYWAIPNFLRAFVVITRLRDLMVLNVSATGLDPLTVKLIDLIASLVAFLFVSMSAFQYVEIAFSNIRLSAIQSCYFIIITIATVGYGDIVPTSDVARVLVMVTLLSAIAYFPRLINGIVETYRVRRDGQSSYIPGRVPFVVVALSYTHEQFFRDALHCCFQALTGISRFLPGAPVQKLGPRQILALSTASNELFADRNNRNQVARFVLSSSYHIVILSPTPISSSLRAVLDSSFYQSRATYIQGSALHSQDLKRAALKKASACFILADRAKGSIPDEAMEEDHLNVLRVWSVRKFASRTPVFVYNLQPETDIHIRPLSRQVVCVNSIKQLILGAACMNPGSAALITALLHRAPALSRYSHSWQAVYADSLNNSLFFAPFVTFFSGKSFRQVAWYLYAEFQVIIIGLRFRVPVQIDFKSSASGEQETAYAFRDHIVLNPGPNFIIPEADIVREIVFVAQSVDDIADIEHLTALSFQETWTKWMSRRPSDSDALGNVLDSVDNSFSCCECLVEAGKPSSKGRNDFSEKELARKVRFDAQVLNSTVPASPPLNVPLHTGLRELGENDVYIGHPRPPHHMVVDNDLQSPFCHMLRQPITAKEAHFRDASQTLLDDRSSSPAVGKRIKLQDHVLVCSDSFSLWTYLCTMRASFLKFSDLNPILILAPELPTEEEWRPLSVFPLVYFLKGSVLKRNDLLRAGVRNASCIVMMKHVHGSSRGQEEERFVDTVAIMGTHQIDFMVQDKYVVTELMSRHNVKFLRAKHEMLDNIPQISVNLAPISTAPLNISHTLRQFSYRETVPVGEMYRFSPEARNADENYGHLENYIRKQRRLVTSGQVHSRMDLNTDEAGYYAHSPIFAAGRVLPDDMLDGLIFESYRTPGIVDAVKLICGRRYQKWSDANDHLGITASILRTVRIPSWLVGKPFSALFHHFCIEHGVVPIGIYRRKTIDHETLPNDGSPRSNLSDGGGPPPQASVPPFNSDRRTTFGFKSVPLYRTATDASVASLSSVSHHLFNLERDDLNSADMWSSAAADMPAWQTHRSQRAQQQIARLLEFANRLDNELPFVLTNPIPDLLLDELDMIFLLQPQA